MYHLETTIEEVITIQLNCNQLIMKMKQTIHIDKKTHICLKCERTFFLKHHLKRHIDTVHEKKKQTKCLFCAFSCYDQGSLNRHTEFVHKTEKPHQCSICELKYKSKGHLKRHFDSVHGSIKTKSANFVVKAFMTRLN